MNNLNKSRVNFHDEDEKEYQEALLFFYEVDTISEVENIIKKYIF